MAHWVGMMYVEMNFIHWDNLLIQSSWKEKGSLHAYPSIATYL